MENKDMLQCIRTTLTPHPMEKEKEKKTAWTLSYWERSSHARSTEGATLASSQWCWWNLAGSHWMCAFKLQAWWRPCSSTLAWRTFCKVTICKSLEMDSSISIFFIRANTVENIRGSAFLISYLGWSDQSCSNFHSFKQDGDPVMVKEYS